MQLTLVPSACFTPLPEISHSRADGHVPPRARRGARRRATSLRPGLFVLALLASSAAVPADAQSGDPAIRFQVTPPATHAIQGLSAAEARALRAVTARVADVLRANPLVTSPPPGPWCTWLHSSVPVFYDSVQRASAAVEVVASPEGCRHLVGSGGVEVSINGFAAARMPVGGFGPQPLGDTGGEFLIEPKPLPPLQGFPQFAAHGNNRRRVVILTRRTAPMWLPVSRERYIRALIADYEANVAGSIEHSAARAGSEMSFEEWVRVEKPKIVAEHQRILADLRGHVPAAELEQMRATFAQTLAATEATMREVTARLEAQRPATSQMMEDARARTGNHVAALRAMLAAMSPAERAAPACLDARKPATAEDPTALVADCEGAARVVTFNGAFFDPALPPGAVQLLTVHTPEPYAEPTPDRPISPGAGEYWRLVYQLYHTTDYSALAALLH